MNEATDAANGVKYAFNATGMETETTRAGKIESPMNLRGEVNIAASSIGAVLIDYNAKLAGDPRGYDPFSGDLLGRVIAGPMLVLGHATAPVRTRGALLLGGPLNTSHASDHTPSVHITSAPTTKQHT
ncbi:hypothetical protein, partial [Bradyrhizobium canariense]|uniref:hypothetical protein n=1 Tax=Bradyrhizobium canariense TaxID=255045 RepID=UPI0030828E64